MIETGLAQRITDLDLFPVHGRVSRIRSGEIEADGPGQTVGAHCLIECSGDRGTSVRAQVVSLSETGVVLMPLGPVGRLTIGDLVRSAPDQGGLPVGDAFAGRAVNALGIPLDGSTALRTISSERVTALPVLDRVSPSRPFATGIRAIDGLLTIGRGQRIGILAASGVGKTSLIEQILHQSEYDRAVVCLVGERGREVEALWREISHSRHSDCTALVAATADESAPMRARAVEQALAIAEYWRNQGKHVLLVIDSVTRLAMALREIGLIAGEPPTARGYTPNVYRELPTIVERCGAARQGGTITAILTVLSETDDVDDPIVELMKSLLDGHIVLSRRLAQSSHFPAIDIGASISRLFDRLVDEQHAIAALRCRAALAEYEEAHILIESGMYKAGSDPEIDRAIALRTELRGYLRQSRSESAGWDELRERLIAIASHGGGRG
jgi:flagellum-specific ATP synthase